ncbi:MAG: hypothetical protein R3E31_14430 [Chloroflexota bacterium]
MLTKLSIKSLYALALAEGEGVGTAYEYFAKRLVLGPWLATMTRPQSLLIAGLPEKYGASLDFLQVAAELETAVTIADDRPAALEKVQKAVTAVQADGWLRNLSLRLVHVHSMAAMAELDGPFDLAFSSEVVQRLADRAAYAQRVQTLAAHAALFTPNADNPAHTNLSGLSGLRRNQLATLLRPAYAVSAQKPYRFGYIDMPPFPPGMTRSDEQREQATTGAMEAFAMWGLAYYARAERLFPVAWRQRQSHIVYALVN